MKKICPYCAEEVQPAAKVCPHCRNWLTIFSLRNPVVGVVCFLLLMLTLLAVMLSFIRGMTNSGRDFTPYQDSLAVIESQMNFHPDQDGPIIYVVVVLTNKCEVAWKNPQLDLRFYNQKGEMVDAAGPTTSGVIYPSGELAVRAKVRPSHEIGEYTSFKVFVRSAVDPRVRF